MKKYWKALANLLVALIVLLVIIFLIPKLLVFFMPFVIGGIVALIASPFVRFFEEKVKLKRKAGTAFVIILVIGLVVFLLYLLLSKLGHEVVSLVNSLPDIWAGMEEDFAEIGTNLDVIYKRLPSNVQDSLNSFTDQLGSYVGSFIGELGTPTIIAVGNFAKQLPTIIIGTIMALLFSYFYVAERKEVYAWFRAHTPESLQYRFQLVKKSLVKAVGGYFKAQLKIEVWMYLLLVIGFSILRVNYAFLIAIGIAFLDLLPFFGTGTVMVPWAIIEILSSDYQMAIGLLIIWGVGQLARQIIQPKIVGDSIGVSAIPTLILLYMGYKLGGVLGMIFAVPLGLIIFTMYEEGIFDTTKNSILILVSGINRFRKLRDEDVRQIQGKAEREKKQEERDAQY